VGAKNYFPFGASRSGAPAMEHWRAPNVFAAENNIGE